jgi:hypothetical protein
VARQHAGITGQVENCVTTVFCSHVTPAGHRWVDWEPHMPESWRADPARRAAARVPADIEFATKPELGARIVARLASGWKLTIRWVAADEVYGRSARFRAAFQDAGPVHVLTVPADFQAATDAGAFRADELADLATFERRSRGPGSKGPATTNGRRWAPPPPATSCSSAARPATRTNWPTSTATCPRAPRPP